MACTISKSAVKAKILHNIFDVLKQLKTIKKGVIKEKDREKIIAVHILTGFYNIGSTKYKTYVVVKEDENNNYYYDSGIVTKIKGS